MDVGSDAARARLAKLSRGGLLTAASADAYGQGIADLVRVGPLGPVPGLSRLAEVRLRDLAGSDDRAALALRWEAIGPGSGLFPVLDANLTLTAAGEQASSLTLTGTYRPPAGAMGAILDRTILHQVAAATIREFLARVAETIASPTAKWPNPGSHMSVHPGRHCRPVPGDSRCGPLRPGWGGRLDSLACHPVWGSLTALGAMGDP